MLSLPVSRPRRRWAAVLLAPLAAVAVAAPASASDHYSVDVFSFMHMNASGSDGSGWTGSLDFDTDLDAQVEGLTVTDHKLPALKPMPNRLYATRFGMNVQLVTALDTLNWTCANVGPARGKPGWVVLDKRGDTGVLSVVASDGAEFTRSCTGYSSSTDVVKLSSQPLKYEFEFPLSELGAGGGVSRRFDVPLPCPPMMAYQNTCSLHWQGNVTLERTDGDGSDTEDPKPEPKPKKTLRRVGGRITKDGKAAKVTVNCATACKGKISATAVATKRMAEKRLETERFSTRDAGPKKVEIIFGGKDARTARRHGAVMFDVKAAPRAGGPSQTKSFTVRVPR